MNKGKIDWDKPLQTRDGRKARLVCKDVKRRYSDDSYLVLVTNKSGFNDWYVVFPSGLYFEAGNGHSSMDIINTPPTIVDVWANVNKATGAICYVTPNKIDFLDDAPLISLPAKLTYEYQPQ